MTDDAPLLALFLENSALDRHTLAGFAEHLDEDGRTARVQPALFYPGADVPLPTTDGALARLHQARRSRRDFGARPLTLAELAALVVAGVAAPDGHRGAPSGGATYPVETFALLWRVEGPLAGRAVYLNADRGTLSDVGPAPPWDPATFGLVPDGAPPAAVVLWVGLPARVTRRYGERGGRFLLLEAGHLAQSLALAAAERGLHACPLGGTLDAPLGRALGLPAGAARVLYGYAVGAPP